MNGTTLWFWSFVILHETNVPSAIQHNVGGLARCHLVLQFAMRVTKVFHGVRQPIAVVAASANASPFQFDHFRLHCMDVVGGSGRLVAAIVLFKTVPPEIHGNRIYDGL